MTLFNRPDPPMPSRWLITILLAGLSTLGPFSIDTYFPAFDGIAADFGASQIYMQQTLSIYLFGFAFMLLFHGTLSDTFGRRPVILISLLAFFAASVGCAKASSIHVLIFFRLVQGLSAGAGVVVGRAVIRDFYDPVEAQKMMSHVTMIFGLAPAIAPIIGGGLYVHFGWHSIFVFIAGISALLLLASYRYLPESLPSESRQPFRFAPLAHNYRMVLLSRRFVLLSLAVSFNFAGFFLYIAASPTFIQKILGLGPTQFAWLFFPSILGIILGAFISGRSAGRLSPKRAIGYGYIIMMAAALINFAYNIFATPTLPWAVMPMMIYTIGMSLTMPAIALLVLELFPSIRGTAASLQSFVTTLLNAIVSGAVAPMLAFSHKTLALGMLCLVGAGLISWLAYRLSIKDLHE
ncbi:MAG TPA: multidrug effflux MFS transporter [Burkholderiales bacterium]|nr:multidrug effflux MFS transporter [Burkholderiales bacterium]